MRRAIETLFPEIVIVEQPSRDVWVESDLSGVWSRLYPESRAGVCFLASRGYADGEWRGMSLRLPALAASEVVYGMRLAGLAVEETSTTRPPWDL